MVVRFGVVNNPYTKWSDYQENYHYKSRPFRATISLSNLENKLLFGDQEIILSPHKPQLLVSNVIRLP